MLLLTSRYKRGRRGRRVRYSIQPSGGVLASKLIHSITKTNEIPFLPSICVNSVYIRIPLLEGAVNDETEDVVGEFYRMAKFLMEERGGGEIWSLVKARKSSLTFAT